MDLRPPRSRLAVLFVVGMLLWEGSGMIAHAQQRPPQREHRAGFTPASDEVFRVVRQFYDYDRGLPLAARTVESWTQDEVAYEKGVFTTQRGEPVPGVLALPPPQDRRVPVVLLLHGLCNAKERWAEDDRIGVQEARLAAGVGVFAIDLQFHGERGAANDYQNPVYLTFGDSLSVRNRDMIVGSTIDARRALDYVANRPDVDPARLAVVGYSMGGLLAGHAATLGPRLRRPRPPPAAALPPTPTLPECYLLPSR